MYVYVYICIYICMYIYVCKVSYCCTESMASVIKSHNKKLTIEINDEHLPCNCREKYECPLDGKC